MGRATRLALSGSGLILLSQGFPLPASVVDAATLGWANGFQFTYPWPYVILAPICGIADALTILSVKELSATLALTLGLSWILWGWRKAIMTLVALAWVLVWGTLVPHPMAKLVAENPSVLLVDFHSHTNASHDGRKSFSPEANRAWHRAQGFGAAFITDHNQVQGSQEAKRASQKDWRDKGYVSLEGEEVSLFRTHLVVLGVKERIDNVPYDSDPARVERFIRDMSKQELPVIASLPEYWFHHWGAGVEQLIKYGISGFEIISSAPRALDFPIEKRLQIVDLCREHNLVITGISDTHGYGFATAAWSAMQIENWRALSPDMLEAAVLQTIKSKGFTAIQVLERPRLYPKGEWQVLGAPFVALLTLWRSLTPWLALSWGLWIWLAAFLYSAPKWLKH